MSHQFPISTAWCGRDAHFQVGVVECRVCGQVLAVPAHDVFHIFVLFLRVPGDQSSAVLFQAVINGFNVAQFVS